MNSMPSREKVDNYWPVKNPNSDERAYTLRHKMFILVGLNPEYEATRKQILPKERVQ